MRRFLFVGAVFVLAACGGDGDSSPPVVMPPDGNAAPQITSSATADVTENETSVITIQATDADGDTLSFSISGRDAGAFDISSAGILTFRAAPDFELPIDDDQDNIYRLTARVSDGKASDTQDLRITVENDREGIRVRRLATGLSDITAIEAIPGQNRLFITERAGRIHLLDLATGNRTLDRTLNNVSTLGDGGLLGLAVEPEFAQSNIYWAFVAATRSRPLGVRGDITIRRIPRTAPEGLLGTGTRLTIIHRSPINSSYGGWIDFDSNGLLYIGVGDAGRFDEAQDPNTQVGKILRLRRNPDPFAGAAPSYFLVPPGNPFRNGGGNPFVFALGMRNPSNATFYNQGLLFGDNGANTFEEVNFLPLDGGGTNFGWPFFEGTRPFQGQPTGRVTAPITEYRKGDGDREGRSVTNGYVYQGPVTGLEGKYVFADRESGNVWAIEAADLDLTGGNPVASRQYQLLNADFEPDLGTIDGIVTFGIDNQNNLYFADSDGEIFVVEPA
ncbi:hypothetical protein GCM10009096_10660 [Parasphingorhabdus litoris]|uniref:Cadherin domain-containing protein n=1 Tax=Parasphingorhabdus litoris TaxID=394733 RepID=A0ABN1AAB5_9SPHN|nr:PQQ-dependent sugar dehydrogenase [Parasphingorhabdus litoris]